MKYTEEFLADVIITATESALDWAETKLYKWNGDNYAEVTIRADGKHWMRITPDIIKKTLDNKFRRPIKYVETQTRHDILVAFEDNDSSNIDAILADIIFQVAYFGELVFG